VRPPCHTPSSIGHKKTVSKARPHAPPRPEVDDSSEPAGGRIWTTVRTVRATSIRVQTQGADGETNDDATESAQGPRLDMVQAVSATTPNWRQIKKSTQKSGATKSASHATQETERCKAADHCDPDAPAAPMAAQTDGCRREPGVDDEPPDGRSSRRRQRTPGRKQSDDLPVTSNRYRRHVLLGTIVHRTQEAWNVTKECTLRCRTTVMSLPITCNVRRLRKTSAH